MPQWIATIGELEREYECEAEQITNAVLLTMHWLFDQGGEPTGDWRPIEGEPERHTIEVCLPITERTLRRWPASWFKRWRVKTRVVQHTTTLSLSVVHDELSPEQRLEFCKSVGIPVPVSKEQ